VRAYVYVISAVLLGCLFGALMWNLIVGGIERDKRIDESWRQFDQRMTQAGCKVTGYVPGMSGWVRPIWMCPDGHVEIGRPQ